MNPANASSDGSAKAAPRPVRIALVGSPNAGKTTVFNSLTGLRAKTGNYPGVTVARRVGNAKIEGHDVLIEDLPGAYSLDPVSPDEQVVADLLGGKLDGIHQPDALMIVMDATTIERSLILVSQALALRMPTCVVVTMIDELEARGGTVDLPRLQAALGVPVTGVVGTKGIGMAAVRALLVHPEGWPITELPPPTDPEQRAGWISSVLESVLHVRPARHAWTDRVDRVLLHPVWGTIIFFAVMVVFFQVIFTWAVPLQGLIGTGFDSLASWVNENVGNAAVAGLIADGIIGGVGTVLQFLPQIVLLFLMISLLENIGYMSRAALVMDRVMARFGLEGRCFVSMLSSYACAVPGIMSTRTIPSSKDRMATIMVAPLMTCSARLPVYTLLIATFVPNTSVFGPLRMQGMVLFGLYLLGTLSALLIAATLKRTRLRGETLPFYMEMPPYRVPSFKMVLIQMWDSARFFLRKAGTIILGTSILMWILLHVPVVTPPDSIPPAQSVSYQLEHSIAGSAGRALEPVFEPLGFNWQTNVAIISSLSAREVFVSTLGQISAAEDDSDQSIGEALASQTNPDGSKVYNSATVAALLVFFVFALQCMSTIAVMRRETNSWRWPAFAFGYMFVLAWTAGLIAHTIASALA